MGKAKHRRHIQTTSITTRRPIDFTLIIVALGGIAVCLTILYTEAKLASGNTGFFCRLAKGASCDVVLTSPYARWFGLPLPIYGLAFYLGSIILAGTKRNEARKRTLLVWLWGLAVATSCGLFLVTRRVLHAVCPLCYTLYAVNITGLAVILAGWRPLAAWFKPTWSKDPLVRRITRFGTLLFAAFIVFGLPNRTSTPQPSQTHGPRNPTVGNSNPGSGPDIQTIYQNMMAQGRVTIPLGSCTPLWGSPAAPIRIFEFSDFQCPYCRAASLVIHDLIQRHGADLYIEYCHFPLDATCNPGVHSRTHAYACQLAWTAECAARQGDFFSVHDAIFQHQDDPARWLAGADGGARYTTCRDDPQVRARVADMIQLGLDLNIEGTPTIYVNGLRVGALPIDLFDRLITLELQRVQHASSP